MKIVQITFNASNNLYALTDDGRIWILAGEDWHSIETPFDQLLDDSEREDDNHEH